MSPTTMKLLEAACEVVGGRKALAECLGIGETLLLRFMNGTRPLPDAVFLRAVDIVLEDRDSRLPPAEQAPLRHGMGG